MTTKYNLRVASSQARRDGVVIVTVEGHRGQRLQAYLSGRRLLAVDSVSLLDGRHRMLCVTRHQHLIGAVEAAIAAHFEGATA